LARLVQTLVIAALLVGAYSSWIGRSPRTHAYAALTIPQKTLSPISVRYRSIVSGRGWTSEGDDRVWSVASCTTGGAAWCIADTRFSNGHPFETDSVAITVGTFEPVLVARYNSAGVLRSEFTPDVVRSRYRSGDGANALFDKRLAAVRRQGAIVNTALLDALLPIAQVPETGYVVLPLQPVRDDEHSDVDRRFDDENREIESLLLADSAVAWYVGRDSGEVMLGDSGATAGKVVKYQASVVTARLADRAVTYWIADSLKAVVKRVTKYRAGPTALKTETAVRIERR
jgi:hypothetical protein